MKFKTQLIIAGSILGFYTALLFVMQWHDKRNIAYGYNTNYISATPDTNLTEAYRDALAKPHTNHWGRIESNTVRTIYGSDTEPVSTVEFKFTPQSELVPPSKYSNAPTIIPQERLLLAERFLEALKAAKLGWTGRAIWDDFAVVSNMVWESFYMSAEQFNRIYGTNTASTIKATTNRAPVNLRVIGGYFDGPPVVDPPYTWRTDTNLDGFRSEIYSNYMRILNEPRPHQFDNQQSR